MRRPGQNRTDMSSESRSHSTIELQAQKAAGHQPHTLATFPSWGTFEAVTSAVALVGFEPTIPSL